MLRPHPSSAVETDGLLAPLNQVAREREPSSQADTRCSPRAWLLVLALITSGFFFPSLFFHSRSRTTLVFKAIPEPAFSAHWILGQQHRHHSSDSSAELRRSFPDVSRNAHQNRLGMYTTTRQWMNVVPNSPMFIDNLVRLPGLGRPPTGSVYMDRPPAGSLVSIPISCLTPRESSIRTLSLPVWTLELVVLFLDSPHFGRAWQTVAGRNGVNFTDESFAWQLSALYVKLDPNKDIVLEVWIQESRYESETDTTASSATAGTTGPNASSQAHTRPRFVQIKSARSLSPDVWYSIVAQSNGHELRLFVNGDFEGSVNISGALAVPPDAAHGDLTLGCGMFAGVAADPCSCLITEARVSEQALNDSEWLWRRRPPREWRWPG